MMDFIKGIVNPKTQVPSTNKIPADRLYLANFKLIKTCGKGAFGRVFIAKRVDDPSQIIAIKRIKKDCIIKNKHVDHIINEKSILNKINHPFMIQLLGTFKDDRYLYFCLEFIYGGEFFTHLCRFRKFPNESVKFYGAHIVLAFEYLHSKNIVFRDLKPENLLLDTTGYLKLTDFGFAKVVEFRTYTLCGTPEYIAPEVLMSRGHGKSCDWWTLGIFLYELSVGKPPFTDDEPMKIYERIIAGKYTFPRDSNKDLRSLIKHLLTRDVSRRYGDLKGGVDDIKNHRWFKHFDFNSLMKKNITPPIIPKVTDKDDFSNFDKYQESVEDTPKVTGGLDPFINW